MSIQDVQALRGKLWTNGFRPVAVYSHDAADWKGQPIPNRGKRPKGEAWEKRARLNPPEAATAGATLDALNTGILCDGLVGLDIDADDPNVVELVLRAATQHLGPAPHRTRADSSRMLLLYRSDDELTKHSVKGTKGKIEALANGQQFVGFGVHPEGAEYVWPHSSPLEFRLEALPAITEASLMAFLEAVAPLMDGDAPKPAVKPSAVADAPAGIVSDEDQQDARNALARHSERLRSLVHGDGRNESLLDAAKTMAGYVGNGSIDRKTVGDELFAASVENGHVAKHGDAQTWATINQGFKYGMNGPFELRSDMQAEITALIVNAFAKLRVSSTQGALPLSAKTWPAPLNADAYIGIAGDFVRLVEPHTEGDPNALLIGFVTAIGSMLGRGAYMEIGATRHYANLFSVIVAETSKGRKGTVTDEIKRFVRMADPSFLNRMLGGLSSGEGLIEAVRDARYEDGPVDATKLPTPKIVDNGVADKRLFVVEGEMGQALQAAGRDGNILSAVLRLAWDGHELRTLARSNKNVCREPHISIFGNITLEELQRLLSSTDRANGFGNRFLWVCATRSKLLPWGGSVDEVALRGLAAKAAHVIECATYYGKCGWMPDAAATWAQEYKRLSATVGGVAAHMSARAEAQILRIALIYTILDGCNNIDLPHLRAALEVWRYCQDSVLYCFGGASGNSTADRIVTMLKAMPEGASLTQISAHFGRNRPKEELQRALDTLKTANKARSETRQTSGRPAVVWFAC